MTNLITPTQKKAASNQQLILDIKDWQVKADITDFDDEDGSKYDEIALKILVDEARTLLLRAQQSL